MRFALWRIAQYTLYSTGQLVAGSHGLQKKKPNTTEKEGYQIRRRATQLALDDYGSPLFLENQKSDALKYKTTDV